MSLDFSDITIVAIDCITPELATEALIKSSSLTNPAKTILCSDQKPFNFPDNFEFRKIKKINNLSEYNIFVFEQLNNFIDTNFCLLIQSDGFVVNPQRWNPEFLKYDYIGAPWPNDEGFAKNFSDDCRVGNGGFSLRSKKLLENIQNLKCPNNEDVTITLSYRKHLESLGIKIAPLHLAKFFSYEQLCSDLDINPETDCFGFHGKTYTDFHKKNIKELHFQFYKNSLIKMSEERLLSFLQNEIGVSDPNYFQANFKGNLEVQQIPEEYSKLLLFFKNTNIKTYLELGVANGGSFFTNSIFLQNSSELIHCVDCLAYRDAPHVLQTSEKILSKVHKLKEFFPQKQFEFFNQTTDDFFVHNTNKYDCIFIDADHSYEGVMKDYHNSLKSVNKDGYLIFHDIANTNTGVAQCWSEVSKNHKIVDTFIHPTNKHCGIGILEI